MFGPNIYGRLYGVRRIDNIVQGFGVLDWAVKAKPGVYTEDKEVYADIMIDASKASSLYGNAETTQPESIRALLLIRY